MALRKPLVLVTGQAQQLQAADTLDPASVAVRADAVNGLMPALMGRWASRTTTVSIANTLTRVIGGTLAANLLKVGTVLRFRATGLLTNTTAASTSVLTVRINATSLGATIVASWSCVLGVVARTNCPFVIDGEITVLAVGVSGTALGQIVVSLNSATPLGVTTTQLAAAVTIDTTAQREVELACISGATTTTWVFHTAYIEVVQP